VAQSKRRFTITPPVPAPPGDPPIGKVVTIDELARMVGRRSARRRAVPDQQLALFG